MSDPDMVDDIRAMGNRVLGRLSKQIEDFKQINSEHFNDFYSSNVIKGMFEIDKNEISEILYEYTINSKIKNNEEIQKLSNLCDLKLRSLNEKLDYYSESINLSNDLPYVRIEDLVISESNVVLPTVVNETLFSFKNTYEDLYNKNVEIFENCVDKISSHKEAKIIVENTTKEILNKLKIKRESCDNKDKIDHYIYILESLSKSERAKIPDNKFGIPETRSYPLDTKKHVRSAIILFGKSDKKYRKELAKRIFQAMEEYNIPYDMIGPKSTLYPYIPEDKRK